MIDNVLQIKSRCTGCTACANACPVQAICMIEDQCGFMIPEVDYTLCIGCRKCLLNCSVIHDNANYLKNSLFETYAAYATSKEIRIGSSSGGIFPLIAEKIINSNGVVYGAAFDDSWNVEHKRITSIKELSQLCGSKYVQSNLCNSYSKCRNDLNNGCPVLFTGTPCQIAGLYMFLEKPYDNLFTVDIICHGVPSPLVWQKYITEKFDISKIKSINFRFKKNGWEKYQIRISCSDNNIYEKYYWEDEYMQGFHKDLYLRESCYNCKFKTENRLSDITLADCWGIEEFNTEMYNELGTSLIIVHNNKGKKMLEDVSAFINMSKIPEDIPRKYNPCIVESVNRHKCRERFFLELRKTKSITNLISEYIDERSLRKKISFHIKNIIRKLQ